MNSTTHTSNGKERVNLSIHIFGVAFVRCCTMTIVFKCHHGMRMWMNGGADPEYVQTAHGGIFMLVKMWWATMIRFRNFYHRKKKPEDRRMGNSKPKRQHNLWTMNWIAFLRHHFYKASYLTVIYIVRKVYMCNHQRFIYILQLNYLLIKLSAFWMCFIVRCEYFVPHVWIMYDMRCEPWIERSLQMCVILKRKCQYATVCVCQCMLSWHKREKLLYKITKKKGKRHIYY